MLRWVDLVQRLAKEKEKQDHNCTAPARQSYNKPPETCRTQPQACWEWTAGHTGWHLQRCASPLLWRMQCLLHPGPLQKSHTEPCCWLCLKMDGTSSGCTCCRSGHLSDNAVSLSSPELSWSVMGLMETPDTTFPLLSPEGLPLQEVQLIRLVRFEDADRPTAACLAHFMCLCAHDGQPKGQGGPASHTCGM